MNDPIAVLIYFSCFANFRPENFLESSPNFALMSRRQSWVLQENKARQIFQKNEHFLSPDTLTYVWV